MKSAHLSEPDLVSVLPEALTAKVKAVLADEAGLVGTDLAIIQQ
jgi:hypothetical protein